MTNPTSGPRAELPDMGGEPPNPTLTEWSSIEEKLAAAPTYWLSTLHPEGRPHAMPIWGIWMDGAFYFVTWPQSRKGRNLANSPRCSIGVSLQGIDVVMEGEAVQISDDATVHRAHSIFVPKYDWSVSVRDGGIYDEHGEGGLVYRVAPKVAFGFGTDGGFSATRWRF